MVLNDKGEFTKGFEILIRQVLKMLQIDPQSTMAQISGIFDLLKTHVDQQAEMLAILKRLDHERPVSAENVGRQPATIAANDAGRAQQPE